MKFAILYFQIDIKTEWNLTDQNFTMNLIEEMLFHLFFINRYTIFFFLRIYLFNEKSR